MVIEEGVERDKEKAKEEGRAKIKTGKKEVIINARLKTLIGRRLYPRQKKFCSDAVNGGVFVQAWIIVDCTKKINMNYWLRECR